MLCTTCHTPIRPVVAIDIDGTLARYHDHFIHFAQLYFGDYIFMSPYTGETTFKEWFAQNGVTIDQYRQAKLAYRQGGWKRSMPMFSDFLMHPSALSPAGAELWIATTRPYLRLDNIDPDTREFLDRNKIRYDGLLFGDNKYEMLIERVGQERIAFILDDLPEQYDVASELGLPIWQIARQHNSAPEAMRPRRVYARDAANRIHQEVENWVETFQSPAMRLPGLSSS